MKTICIFSIIFTVLPFFAYSSDVLVFTDSDFEARIKNYEVLLIESYAPWCGHCKKLAPEYEKAATTLKKHDLYIAKVDCTAETKTCEKHGVSGYPTLKLFKGGAFSMDYNSERNADGIVKYMISKSGPTARELKTLDDAVKYLDKTTDTVIFGAFDDAKSEGLEALKTAANALSEDFRFYYTSSSDVAEKYGNKNKLTIRFPKKLHSKFEDKVLIFDGSFTQNAVKTWIEENIMGLCGVRGSSTAKYFETKPLIVAFYNVDYEKDPKGTNYIRNRVMKVGKKLLDAGKKFKMAISNSLELSYELAEFGVDSPDNKKVYITARNEKGGKFKMDADFSMESFEQFLNDFLDGKLTPYLKSEAVPDNSDNDVKVVVAKNFDEIVNDPEKDVLIEFYAPWCGHCKSLAPKYEELAKKLKNEKSIVIAKMDATANDVPAGYDVKGFPTLYFAPRNGKKNPLPYSGGREVDDFVNYLANQATDELSGFDRKGKAKKTEF